MKPDLEQYNNHKANAETMLLGYENFIYDLESRINLGKLSLENAIQERLNYEDELHFRQFFVWQYELQEKLKIFEASRNEFLTLKMGTNFTEMINGTGINERFNWRLVERINKLTNEAPINDYKALVKHCKSIPVHLSKKNHFPFRDIDKNKTEDEI